MLFFVYSTQRFVCGGVIRCRKIGRHVQTDRQTDRELIMSGDIPAELLKPSWQIGCGIPSGGFLSPGGVWGITTRPLTLQLACPCRKHHLRHHQCLSACLSKVIVEVKKLDPVGFEPPVWLSVCLSACLSVCLSVCLPVCLSVCLSACLSVCLSVCLSGCL